MGIVYTRVRGQNEQQLRMCSESITRGTIEHFFANLNASDWLGSS